MANPNPNTDGLTPFKPGQSGNPNGRPRKMVSQVLKDLGDANIESVSKQQVVGAIETLLNCQEEDLKSYANDKSHSMLIRIVANHILNADEDDRLLDMMLDRAFGKAKQHTDVTTQGDKINEVDYSKLPQSAIDAIIEAENND